jgi:cytoplasmic iron level regulating protein YaaA (DUF328/UPF0246 family)
MFVLLPPSEWKQPWGYPWQTSLSIRFDTYPRDILHHATPKDLKCTGSRYEQALQLNKTITTSPVLPAMHRYTGVLYKALDYHHLSKDQQHYINTHVGIISGLYGLVLPQDMIPNYKLPIETKGLTQYRAPLLTTMLMQHMHQIDTTTIVSLLPWSYAKAINRDQLKQAWYTIITPTPDTHLANTHMIKHWRGARLRTHVQSNS